MRQKGGGVCAVAGQALVVKEHWISGVADLSDRAHAAAEVSSSYPDCTDRVRSLLLFAVEFRARF